MATATTQSSAIALESDGLRVRPLTPQDADALYVAVRSSISELAGWLPWCTPQYSLQDSQTWVAHCQRAWAQRTEFPLGIFDAASGTLLGGTGINHIDPVFHSGNLGYWVATPATGRGVARTAAALATGFAFAELALTRIEIIVLPQNLASQRVAEALGARRECLARNRIHFQGKPHDAVVYSLVPEDQVAKRSPPGV